VKDKLLWALFVAVSACAVAALVGYFLRPGGLPRVPEFDLIERSGKPVARRDLLGQVWVADFIFLNCPTACPRMNSAMFDLQKRLPEVRFISFTVDPERDTAARLDEFVRTNGLASDRWLWATGPTVDAMQKVAHGFLQPSGKEGNQIVHSERFVVVDRYGRIRAAVPILDPETFEKNPKALAAIEEGVRGILAERYLPVHLLPAVNCGLNATCTVLLLLGLGLIKAKRIGAHRACMLLALACSAVFLVGYLTAHHFLGSTPYKGSVRAVYFSILISHSILAAIIVPLAGITLFRALADQVDRHRAIARWTLPLWLYVSVTGVVIYFMLYG